MTRMPPCHSGRRGPLPRAATFFACAALACLVTATVAGGAARADAATTPAPAPAGGGAPAPAAAPLTVTAKIVEIPSKFPPDDLYDYAYVMRYEVIGGPMNGKPIYVAHYKPRQARNAIKDQMKKVVSGKVRNFHVGDVHKLQLTPDLKSVWKGALVDEFAATDHKTVRYFALVADPA
jgi:hypothetical protein